MSGCTHMFITFFSFMIMTTLGVSQEFPKTYAGQIFTGCYALAAVPVMIYFLTLLGRKVVKLVAACATRRCCGCCCDGRWTRRACRRMLCCCCPCCSCCPHYRSGVDDGHAHTFAEAAADQQKRDEVDDAFDMYDFDGSGALDEPGEGTTQAAQRRCEAIVRLNGRLTRAESTAVTTHLGTKEGGTA